jgi:FlaA1/EpsC-like NDP-sugar epimerase
MIELSGLEVKDDHNPEGDIAIEITGLRPGEKLYEELLIDNHSSPTMHPKVFKANEKYLPLEELLINLEKLKRCINEEKIYPNEIYNNLCLLVSGYHRMQ